MEPVALPVAGPSRRRGNRQLVRIPGDLSTLPTQSLERSEALRSLRHGADLWLSQLDITQSLVGHSGCVNALSWSEDGARIVSGSDDFRLCIHRAGVGAESGDGPRIGVELETVIRTGHSRNSASVQLCLSRRSSLRCQVRAVHG